ncbi:MAG: GNAT family N-acetyltransferase [Actinobacteria bacterium]|nr:GNAT family N-acetyltransferase [Actinomycetota bacterium]
MIQDFLTRHALELQRSESESRRFGFEVARLLIPAATTYSDEEIIGVLKNSRSALIILRAESTRTTLFAKLKSMVDFESLHADTLVYYCWRTDTVYESDSAAESFAISDCPSWAEVESVLTESFADYKNHYSAEPNALTLVALDRESSRVIGFVLLTIDPAEQLAEIALNAVRPSAQRSGVYTALMREARRRVSSRSDIRSLYISTQSDNGAVIGAWQKLGLTPQLTLNTFHLMRRETFGSTDAR